MQRSIPCYTCTFLDRISVFASKEYLISNVTIHSILTTSFIQLPKEHILDIKYITCHVVNKSVVS